MKRFQSQSIFMLIAAILVCTGTAVAWQNILQNTATDPVRKGSAFSIASQLNFRYDRTRVWAALTSAKGFQAITGIVIATEDADKSFTKSGDSMNAQLGDLVGRVVVTSLDPNRVLRVSFESEDADVVDVRRFVLATVGEGCVLQYRIQFTDLSEGGEESATKVRDHVAGAAIAFRKIAEPRPMPRSH